MLLERYVDSDSFNDCILHCNFLTSPNRSFKIFANLLDAIMHAPMSYFDTTPVGRIVNRFSQDMYTIDSQLMSALRSYLTTFMAVCSTVVVISGVTPAFTICLIPIFLFYASQQRFFTVSTIMESLEM